MLKQETTKKLRVQEIDGFVHSVLWCYWLGDRKGICPAEICCSNSEKL